MSVKGKIWKLHEAQIRRTKPEGDIPLIKIRLTKITKRTKHIIGSNQRKIYMQTRSLKHLYDKKPAEEFDFLIDHLIMIIRAPDFLYRNKNKKENRFCIIKKLDDHFYIVVIEIIKKISGSEEIHVVTTFRIRDDKYLKNYDLLRSWRDGAHSS